MMPYRLLGGIAASAAIAGFLAGVLSLHAPLHAAPAAPSTAPSTVTPAAPARSADDPLEPVPFPGERPRVPAGILARAADARALDRGPSCPAPEEHRAPPPRCASEQRESIEIDWHVDPKR